MTTRTVRRRLDREGLAWEAQKGGIRRTQLAQRRRDVICQPWVEQQLYTGRAEVYERIVEHMWEAEGDLYGIQPSDHKYGQQTTDAMKQKKGRRGQTYSIRSPTYATKNVHYGGYLRYGGDGLPCNELKGT